MINFYIDVFLIVADFLLIINIFYLKKKKEYEYLSPKMEEKIKINIMKVQILNYMMDQITQKLLLIQIILNQVELIILLYLVNKIIKKN